MTTEYKRIVFATDGASTSPVFAIGPVSGSDAVEKLRDEIPAAGWIIFGCAAPMSAAEFRTEVKRRAPARRGSSRKGRPVAHDHDCDAEYDPRTEADQ